MGRKYLIIMCVLAAALIADSQLAVEIQEPRISRFLNRITNTTFDVIRTGVNIFSSAVDRIITTFSTIEERLGALVELVRKQLIKGVPELNIPILDPLHIQRIDFDLNHDSAKLKGHAKDLTIRHISKFIVNRQQLSDLGKLRFQLDFNLTFPLINVNGTYKIDGTVGDAFKIHGEGPFWVNLIDLQIAVSAILKFNLPARLRVEKLNIDAKLGKLENKFDGLMNDPETGELFNKVITRLAPEALRIMWPEIKPTVEVQIKNITARQKVMNLQTTQKGVKHNISSSLHCIKKTESDRELRISSKHPWCMAFRTYINNILENATVVNLAKRVFNLD